ncbi:MAG: SH3 domain-containing protein [Lachnospiraceae bacterium]|nr:SH3 domain-containing protein [Lachnospiraceae bacterium]
MKLNFRNVKLAVFFAAAAAFMTGAPVLGAEFTTPDAVLTLQTPGDDWKQVDDSETWATLTDGNDRITLLHYSNGEKLPEITVAGNGYAQVCQNIISTENEVFIITGSVVDKKDFEEIQEAVQSAEIEKYDTKKAVKPAAGTAGIASVTGTNGAGDKQEAGSQKTVEAAQFTAWVISQQLNVRSESSTDASVLATIYYMDAVEVTGVEKAGGAETGWYQINYNGSAGYVASEYVSTEPETAESLGYTLTSEQVTLYTPDGTAAAYVYKATNGSWYDGSGRQYQTNGAGQWTCLTSGAAWTESTEASSGSQVALADEDGYNQVILYQQEDGSWQNIAGGVFADNGDGTWTGPDGTVWRQK